MTGVASRMAVQCAGALMLDARSRRPIVGDRLVGTLLDENGLQAFEPFRALRAVNAMAVVRHHIIDEALRDRFRGRPRRLTILLGAGLDTRPFRMATGEWVEIDAPDVIGHKERLLPAGRCPVPLTRVPFVPGRNSLADALAPFATDAKVTVVAEALAMFLPQDEVASMLGVLGRLFPQHTLICDLATRRFARRYGDPVQRALAGPGAQLACVDDPAEPFVGAGYSGGEARSVALCAAEMGVLGVPEWVVRWFAGTLRDGYQVHVWRLGAVGRR